MSAYLDLDDVCAGNPKAKEELDALRAEIECQHVDISKLKYDLDLARADLANKTRQIQQYAENETEREKALMEEIADLRAGVEKIIQEYFDKQPCDPTADATRMTA